ncbi:MAG: class I SAM-dependent methyltransferase [Vicinamibacterales bacterium]
MIGEYVLRKLACPDGHLAGFFSKLLNLSNAALNAAVIGKLSEKTGQALLDIGFGGGVGIDLALADVRVARVAGIDPSQAMVRAAQTRYRKPSTGKAVDIRRGAAERLPWRDDAFDAVISVNALYYWNDLITAFAEIKRVLRPGGVLVLGLRAKVQMDRVDIEKYGYRSPSSDELADALVAAGFAPPSVEERVGSRRGGEVVIRAVAA